MGRLKELKDIYPFSVSLLMKSLKEKKVANAYLFEGRGAKEFDIAVRFAQALLCHQEVSDGCGRCKDCLLVASNSHPSVYIKKLDGKSFLVQDAKDIEESVLFPPEGNYRVVVIDWLERFSKEAINSILKTIEEPPEGVVFVITTPHRFNLPETIISRCQIVPFYAEDRLRREVYKVGDRLLSRAFTKEDILNLGMIDREGARLLARYLIRKLIESKRVKVAEDLLEMEKMFETYNLNVQIFLDNVLLKLLEV